ncbi:MAG: peptidase M23 [Flavobacteriaceae bacterium]|nr:peptidase M23 [Flavobacteriaceae bacterium]
MIFNRLILIFFLTSLSTSLNAQNYSEKQKQLEFQRKKLHEEIKQINSLLFLNTKKEKSLISQTEDLSIKISVRMKLIATNNEQANILQNQINVNEREISNLRNDLKTLKNDYAKMIQNSYQSKSSKSRLMFIFSSENFSQAYKRLQYLKQYSEFRINQGEKIVEKAKAIQETTNILKNQRNKKKIIANDNMQIKEILEKEKKFQNENLLSLKKKGISLASEIKKKQQRSASIDREIDRLIKEAIAESNKNKDPLSNEFNLTPELKILSKNFVLNKGKLPWPVEKGIVIQNFGRQPHSIIKTAIIKSNGVTIATVKDASIRAVFDGEVMSVLSFKGSNPTILIRHGNYISTYKNIGKVFVNKGDKIVSKQVIGEAFTHPNSGKTTLQFGIFEGVKPINPKMWIYKM